MRSWSKWRWNIPYWVTSEVYAKSHDDPFATDGATDRGIPSDAKLGTQDEHEIQVGYAQSDVDIYIIGPPLKYMPSAMTIRWLWTEPQPGEFPKMRNYN